MPIKFIWDESYETGYQDIDAQHKKMFDLANALSKDMVPAQMQQVVLELHRHINENLETEEILMRDADYPGIDTHRELHHELMKRLVEVGNEIADGNWSVDALQKLIYDWIVEDVMQQDSAFFKFLGRETS